ncbi:hypothetical protein Tco_0483042 [Tanacetum coccineum]
MIPKAVLMKSCLVSLTTARPVNTAQPKTTVNSVNVVKGNHVNAVKASAYWVWKPKTKFIDHVSNITEYQSPLKSLIMLMHKADPSQ